MRLFVIMSNDYPAGVMDDEAKALALVKERNDADKARRDTGQAGWSIPVYWRVYPLNLNEVAK